MKIYKIKEGQAMKHEEFSIQCAVVEYIRKAYPNALFCASIAGAVRMTIPQWTRAKRAGYSAGFPDLIIYEAVGNLHGMALELKTAKGIRSPAQILWQVELTKRGYHAVTAWGVDEAVREIDKYLRGVI